MKDNPFWNTDWMATQQKYWKQWTDLSLKAMGGGPPAHPWEGALDHWWKAVAPAAPAPAEQFMEKMMAQGKHFFRMAEDFSRNLSATSTGTDWTSAVEKTFADLQQAFAGGVAEGDDPLHKMMAFWELPSDNWQRMVSSLSLTPGDALRNMPHDQVKESLHRFLSAPGLGYAREEQSQYQDLIRRNLEYQSALREYLLFFSNLGVKSVERAQQTLQRLDGEERIIDSARGLYDLWVTACEEVYAEQVMTPEYSAIHGKLVNALMALKHRMMVMVDESLGAMNMPTRSELRTLQDRLQENRRENKILRQELEDLRERVAGLGASPSQAPKAKAPVRRKTVTKKTAASKSTAKRQ